MPRFATCQPSPPQSHLRGMPKVAVGGPSLPRRKFPVLLKGQKPTLSSVGNCELVAKIADSGMGMVYKARSRATGEVVAVKVMPPFEPDNAPALQRFARECRILSALHDPHIVRAVDFGLDGPNPYLVMGFLEGGTLGERLQRQGKQP